MKKNIDNPDHAIIIGFGFGIIFSIIILLETSLSFVSANYIYGLFLESREDDIIYKIYSLITLLIYFEISFMFYALFIDSIGLSLSIFVALCILLVLIVLDIYVFVLVPKKYTYTINWIVFSIISIFILVFLNNGVFFNANN